VFQLRILTHIRLCRVDRLHNLRVTRSRMDFRLTHRWRKRDSNFESVQGNWLYPDIDPTSAPGAADQKIATLGSNFARVFDPFKRPFPAEN